MYDIRISVHDRTYVRESSEGRWRLHGSLRFALLICWMLTAIRDSRKMFYVSFSDSRPHKCRLCMEILITSATIKKENDLLLRLLQHIYGKRRKYNRKTLSRELLLSSLCQPNAMLCIKRHGFNHSMIPMTIFTRITINLQNEFAIKKYEPWVC